MHSSQICRDRALLAATLLSLVVCFAPIRAVASSTPAIWQITDGYGELYLMGSIHALHKDTYPYGDAFPGVYNRANRIVFELDPDKIDTLAVSRYALAKARLKEWTTISEVVSKRDYQRSAMLLRQLGYDPKRALSAYKPWFWMIKALSYQLSHSPPEARYGVEATVRALAKRDKVPIESLEDPTQLIDALDRLPLTAQGRLMSEALEHAVFDFNETQDIKNNWAQGDVEAQIRYTDRLRLRYPRYYKFLVVRRTEEWMPILQQYIADGNVTLVVVGFTHIYGKDGMLQKFIQGGYTIRRAR